MKNFEYFKPETLEEASSLLVKYGENAHILNGGTDLIVRMRDEITAPDAVIDIKGIKELNRVDFDKEKGLFVGACVTLNEMIHNPNVKENYDILAKSAKTVGSAQVRNKATMIGNICNASPLADTATPLLALDAVVEIYSPKGEREVSIHDFFVWVRKTSLEHGEIVKGIRIPFYKDMDGVFQKLSRRKEVDLSTVCASVIRAGGEFRIALGSVAPTPIRVRKTEDLLKGKDLTDAFIEEIAEIASSETAPIDDVRASKEYRLEMVKVLVERGLKEIVNK